jgi:ribosomal protein L11 methylase PrmA
MSAVEPILRDPGSFRDPKGHVFSRGTEILRTVNFAGAEGYERARDNGLLGTLQSKGRLIDTEELDPEMARACGLGAKHVLRHARLPFISYPYEWSFHALKDAALLHLDVILESLDRDVVLSDASAYNIQFDGYRPLFIDVLSFQPYAEGTPWLGYRQFCEQFLNPLLLTALFGVSHHAWYRGSFDGIPTGDIARLFRLRDRFSLRLLSHVLLQAKLQRRSRTDAAAAGVAARKVRLSRHGYGAIVSQLRDWIAGLTPAGDAKTAWADYACSHSYAEGEYTAKQATVAAFCQRIQPKTLWDIGCNSGDFAATALRSGAGFVVGFDADPVALGKAYARAKDGRLNFIPLYQDLASPSPNQGWNQEERRGIDRRRCANAVLALAVVHHLAIGRNVPLPDVVRWLVGLAPNGIIEFVPKSDPMVQIMLAARDDIFDSYNEEAFTQALRSRAAVIDRRQISATNRVLFTYSIKN